MLRSHRKANPSKLFGKRARATPAALAASSGHDDGDPRKRHDDDTTTTGLLRKKDTPPTGRGAWGDPAPVSEARVPAKKTPPAAAAPPKGAPPLSLARQVALLEEQAGLTEKAAEDQADQASRRARKLAAEERARGAARAERLRAQARDKAGRSAGDAGAAQALDEAAARGRDLVAASEAKATRILADAEERAARLREQGHAKAEGLRRRGAELQARADGRATKGPQARNEGGAGPRASAAGRLPDDREDAAAVAAHDRRALGAEAAALAGTVQGLLDGAAGTDPGKVSAALLATDATGKETGSPALEELRRKAPATYRAIQAQVLAALTDDERTRMSLRFDDLERKVAREDLQAGLGRGKARAAALERLRGQLGLEAGAGEETILQRAAGRAVVTGARLAEDIEREKLDGDRTKVAVARRLVRGGVDAGGARLSAAAIAAIQGEIVAKEHEIQQAEGARAGGERDAEANARLARRALGADAEALATRLSALAGVGGAAPAPGAPEQLRALLLQTDGRGNGLADPALAELREKSPEHYRALRAQLLRAVDGDARRELARKLGEVEAVVASKELAARGVKVKGELDASVVADQLEADIARERAELDAGKVADARALLRRGVDATGAALAPDAVARIEEEIEAKEKELAARQASMAAAARLAPEKQAELRQKLGEIQGAANHLLGPNMEQARAALAGLDPAEIEYMRGHWFEVNKGAILDLDATLKLVATGGIALPGDGDKHGGQAAEMQALLTGDAGKASGAALFTALSGWNNSKLALEAVEKMDVATPEGRRAAAEFQRLWKARYPEESAGWSDDPARFVEQAARAQLSGVLSDDDADLGQHLLHGEHGKAAAVKVDGALHWYNDSEQELYAAIEACKSPAERKELAAALAERWKDKGGMDGLLGKLDGAEKDVVKALLEGRTADAEAAKVKAAAEGVGGKDAFYRYLEGKTDKKERDEAIARYDRLYGKDGSLSKGPDFDAVVTKKFDTVLDVQKLGGLDRERMKMLMEKGELDAGFELHYALHGAVGKDMEKVRHALGRMTEEQLRRIRENPAAMEQLFGSDGYWRGLWIHADADVSGKDAAEVKVLLQGKDFNHDGKLDARDTIDRLKARHEADMGSGAGVLAHAADKLLSTRTDVDLELGYDRALALEARLDARGGLSAADRAELEKIEGIYDINQKNVMAGREEVANAAATYAETIVATAVSIASLGTTAPAFWAALGALAGGTAKLATKMAIEGDRLTHGEIAEQLAMTFAQAISAGAFGGKAVQDYFKELGSGAGAFGRAILQKLPIGALKQGAGSVGQKVLSFVVERTLEGTANALLPALTSALANPQIWTGDGAPVLAELLVQQLGTGVLTTHISGVMHGDGIAKMALHKAMTEIVSNWDAIKEALESGQLNEGTLIAAMNGLRGLTEHIFGQARHVEESRRQLAAVHGAQEAWLAAHPARHPDELTAHRELLDVALRSGRPPAETAEALAGIARKLGEAGATPFPFDVVNQVARLHGLGAEAHGIPLEGARELVPEVAQALVGRASEPVSGPAESGVPSSAVEAHSGLPDVGPETPAVTPRLQGDAPLDSAPERRAAIGQEPPPAIEVAPAGDVPFAIDPDFFAEGENRRLAREAGNAARDHRAGVEREARRRADMLDQLAGLGLPLHELPGDGAVAYRRALDEAREQTGFDDARAVARGAAERHLREVLADAAAPRPTAPGLGASGDRDSNQARARFAERVDWLVRNPWLGKADAVSLLRHEAAVLEHELKQAQRRAALGFSETQLDLPAPRSAGGETPTPEAIRLRGMTVPLATPAMREHIATTASAEASELAGKLRAAGQEVSHAEVEDLTRRLERLELERYGLSTHGDDTMLTDGSDPSDAAEVAAYRRLIDGGPAERAPASSTRSDEAPPALLLAPEVLEASAGARAIASAAVAASPHSLVDARNGFRSARNHPAVKERASARLASMPVEAQAAYHRMIERAETPAHAVMLERAAAAGHGVEVLLELELSMRGHAADEVMSRWSGVDHLQSFGASCTPAALQTALASVDPVYAQWLADHREQAVAQEAMMLLSGGGRLSPRGEAGAAADVGAGMHIAAAKGSAVLEQMEQATGTSYRVIALDRLDVGGADGSFEGAGYHAAVMAALAQGQPVVFASSTHARALIGVVAGPGGAPLYIMQNPHTGETSPVPASALDMIKEWPAVQLAIPSGGALAEPRAERQRPVAAAPGAEPTMPIARRTRLMHDDETPPIGEVPAGDAIGVAALDAELARFRATAELRALAIDVANAPPEQRVVGLIKLTELARQAGYDAEIVGGQPAGEHERRFEVRIPGLVAAEGTAIGPAIDIADDLTLGDSIPGRRPMPVEREVAPAMPAPSSTYVDEQSASSRYEQLAEEWLHAPAIPETRAAELRGLAAALGRDAAIAELPDGGTRLELAGGPVWVVAPEPEASDYKNGLGAALGTERPADIVTTKREPGPDTMPVQRATGRRGERPDRAAQRRSAEDARARAEREILDLQLVAREMLKRRLDPSEIADVAARLEQLPAGSRALDRWGELGFIDWELPRQREEHDLLDQLPPAARAELRELETGPKAYAEVRKELRELLLARKLEAARARSDGATLSEEELASITRAVDGELARDRDAVPRELRGKNEQELLGRVTTLADAHGVALSFPERPGARVTAGGGEQQAVPTPEARRAALVELFRSVHGYNPKVALVDRLVAMQESPAYREAALARLGKQYEGAGLAPERLAALIEGEAQRLRDGDALQQVEVLGDLYAPRERVPEIAAFQRDAPAYAVGGDRRRQAAIEEAEVARLVVQTLQTRESQLRPLGGSTLAAGEAEAAMLERDLRLGRLSPDEAAEAQTRLRAHREEMRAAAAALRESPGVAAYLRAHPDSPRTVSEWRARFGHLVHAEIPSQWSPLPTRPIDLDFEELERAIAHDERARASARARDGVGEEADLPLLEPARGRSVSAVPDGETAPPIFASMPVDATIVYPDLAGAYHPRGFIRDIFPEGKLPPGYTRERPPLAEPPEAPAAVEPAQVPFRYFEPMPTGETVVYPDVAGAYHPEGFIRDIFGDRPLPAGYTRERPPLTEPALALEVVLPSGRVEPAAVVPAPREAGSETMAIDASGQGRVGRYLGAWFGADPAPGAALRSDGGLPPPLLPDEARLTLDASAQQRAAELVAAWHGSDPDVVAALRTGGEPTAPREDEHGSAPGGPRGAARVQEDARSTGGRPEVRKFLEDPDRSPPPGRAGGDAPEVEVRVLSSTIDVELPAGLVLPPADTAAGRLLHDAVEQLARSPEGRTVLHGLAERARGQGPQPVVDIRPGALARRGSFSPLDQSVQVGLGAAFDERGRATELRTAASVASTLGHEGTHLLDPDGLVSAVDVGEETFVSAGVEREKRAYTAQQVISDRTVDSILAHGELGAVTFDEHGHAIDGELEQTLAARRAALRGPEWERLHEPAHQSAMRSRLAAAHPELGAAELEGKLAERTEAVFDRLLERDLRRGRFRDLLGRPVDTVASRRRAFWRATHESASARRARAAEHEEQPLLQPRHEDELAPRSSGEIDPNLTSIDVNLGVIRDTAAALPAERREQLVLLMEAEARGGDAKIRAAFAAAGLVPATPPARDPGEPARPPVPAPAHEPIALATVAAVAAAPGPVHSPPTLRSGAEADHTSLAGIVGHPAERPTRAWPSFKELLKVHERGLASNPMALVQLALAAAEEGLAIQVKYSTQKGSWLEPLHHQVELKITGNGDRHKFRAVAGDGRIALLLAPWTVGELPARAVVYPDLSETETRLKLTAEVGKRLRLRGFEAVDLRLAEEAVRAGRELTDHQRAMLEAHREVRRSILDDIHDIEPTSSPDADEGFVDSSTPPREVLAEPRTATMTDDAQLLPRRQQLRVEPTLDPGHREPALVTAFAIDDREAAGLLPFHDEHSLPVVPRDEPAKAPPEVRTLEDGSDVYPRQAPISRAEYEALVSTARTAAHWRLADGELPAMPVKEFRARYAELRRISNEEGLGLSETDLAACVLGHAARYGPDTHPPDREVDALAAAIADDEARRDAATIWNEAADHLQAVPVGQRAIRRLLDHVRPEDRKATGFVTRIVQAISGREANLGVAAPRIHRGLPVAGAWFAADRDMALSTVGQHEDHGRGGALRSRPAVSDDEAVPRLRSKEEVAGKAAHEAHHAEQLHLVSGDTEEEFLTAYLLHEGRAFGEEIELHREHEQKILERGSEDREGQLRATRLAMSRVRGSALYLEAHQRELLVARREVAEEHPFLPEVLREDLIRDRAEQAGARAIAETLRGTIYDRLGRDAYVEHAWKKPVPAEDGEADSPETDRSPATRPEEPFELPRGATPGQTAAGGMCGVAARSLAASRPGSEIVAASEVLGAIALPFPHLLVRNADGSLTDRALIGNALAHHLGGVLPEPRHLPPGPIREAAMRLLSVDTWPTSEAYQAAVRSLFPQEPGAVAAAPAATAASGEPELVHSGGEPERHLAALREGGLLPTTSILVGGTPFKVGQMFPVVDGRLGVFIEVEVDGKRYLRAAYRSSSHGEFRILPSSFEGPEGVRAVRLPELDKGQGVGEHGLRLPSAVQEHLAGDLLAGRIAGPIGETEGTALLKGGAPIMRSLYAVATAERSLEAISRHVSVTELLGAPRGEPLPTSSGDEVRDPADVRVADPTKEPDFTRPVRQYRTRTAVAGEVDVIVVPSLDGSYEYAIYKAASGHAWVAGVSDVSSPINRFGVHARAVDAGELATPLWEHEAQIAHSMIGREHPERAGYHSAWGYLEKIATIQELYRATGVARPEGEPTGVDPKQAQLAVRAALAQVEELRALGESLAPPYSATIEGGAAVREGLQDYFGTHGTAALDPMTSDGFRTSLALQAPVQAHHAAYLERMQTSELPEISVQPGAGTIRPPHFSAGEHAELEWHMRPDGTMIGFRPYDDGIRGRNGTSGVYDIVSSDLQDLLGFDVVARARNARIGGRPGVVFEVLGEDYRPVALSEASLATAPRYAESLAALQVFDFLAGAHDRNAHNVRYREPVFDGEHLVEAGKLKAIDHEDSFGGPVIPLHPMGHLSGGALPERYPDEVVAAMRRLTIDGLREALWPLHPLEVEAAIARYHVIMRDIEAKEPAAASSAELARSLERFDAVLAVHGGGAAVRELAALSHGEQARVLDGMAAETFADLLRSSAGESLLVLVPHTRDAKRKLALWGKGETARVQRDFAGWSAHERDQTRLERLAAREEAALDWIEAEQVRLAGAGDHAVALMVEDHLQRRPMLFAGAQGMPGATLAEGLMATPTGRLALGEIEASGKAVVFGREGSAVLEDRIRIRAQRTRTGDEEAVHEGSHLRRSPRDTEEALVDESMAEVDVRRHRFEKGDLFVDDSEPHFELYTQAAADAYRDLPETMPAGERGRLARAAGLRALAEHLGDAVPQSSALRDEAGNPRFDRDGSPRLREGAPRTYRELYDAAFANGGLKERPGPQLFDGLAGGEWSAFAPPPATIGYVSSHAALEDLAARLGIAASDLRTWVGAARNLAMTKSGRRALRVLEQRANGDGETRGMPRIRREGPLPDHDMEAVDHAEQALYLRSGRRNRIGWWSQDPDGMAAAAVSGARRLERAQGEVFDHVRLPAREFLDRALLHEVRNRAETIMFLRQAEAQAAGAGDTERAEDLYARAQKIPGYAELTRLPEGDLDNEQKAAAALERSEPALVERYLAVWREARARRRPESRYRDTQDGAAGDPDDLDALIPRGGK